VEFVDGDAQARIAGRQRRILGGWELKPFAIAYAPWREVFYLDADAYPAAYDPELLIDDPRAQATGAVFWPDQNPLQRGQFERFGIEYRREPAFESGQLYIDKGRHWPALATTIFFNDYSDYVYKHVYGDKDTFHLAWRACGHDYVMPADSPGWDTIAFVHADFDGDPFVVHRTRDKFRFAGGQVDGIPVAHHTWYMTPQWSFGQLAPSHGGKISRSVGGNLRVDSLPMESLAHDLLEQLEQLFRPDGKNGRTATADEVAQASRL